MKNGTMNTPMIVRTSAYAKRHLTSVHVFCMPWSSAMRSKAFVAYEFHDREIISANAATIILSAVKSVRSLAMFLLVRGEKHSATHWFFDYLDREAAVAEDRERRLLGTTTDK